MRITVVKSPTADSRSCDVSKVSKETLKESTRSHVADVRCAFLWVFDKLIDAMERHDADKLSESDRFYENFATEFENHDWLDDHYTRNRHHLDKESGVRDDVNLIDLIEHVVDCVVASQARSGKFSQAALSDELLQKAVRNTADQLLESIDVVD